MGRMLPTIVTGGTVLLPLKDLFSIINKVTGRLVKYFTKLPLYFRTLDIMVPGSTYIKGPNI